MSSHAAVVLVHATPEAEAAANKSGMKVVDLFRPFNVSSLPYTVSTIGDPYQLKGFSLRFVHFTCTHTHVVLQRGPWASQGASVGTGLPALLFLLGGHAFCSVRCHACSLPCREGKSSRKALGVFPPPPTSRTRRDRGDSELR